MYQFRKKPVVIEAFQFQRRNNGPIPYPYWYDDAMTRNDIILHNTGKWGDITQPAYCEIKTLEGTMRADEGDWVIRGVKGEIYPCKPDIFEATYEPEAARATPAQPDSVLWAAAEKLANIWDGCEGEGIDDIGATIRHDFKMFAKELGAQQPSPSSVGAAIRSLALPEPDAYLGMKREPLFSSASIALILSEAAALAEQVQGQQVPEGWQLVPKEPTPEMIAAFAFRGDVEMAIGHAAIYEDACEDYAEMLHAAPSIAQDGQKSEVHDG